MRITNITKSLLALAMVAATVEVHARPLNSEQNKTNPSCTWSGVYGGFGVGAILSHAKTTSSIGSETTDPTTNVTSYADGPFMSGSANVIPVIIEDTGATYTGATGSAATDVGKFVVERSVVDQDRVAGSTQFVARGSFEFLCPVTPHSLVGFTIDVDWNSGATEFLGSLTPVTVAASYDSTGYPFNDGGPIQTKQSGNFSNTLVTTTEGQNGTPTSADFQTTGTFDVSIKNSWNFAFLAKFAYALNEKVMAGMKIGPVITTINASATLEGSTTDSLYLVNSFGNTPTGTVVPPANLVIDYNNSDTPTSETLSATFSTSKTLTGLVVAPIVQFKLSDKVVAFVEARGSIFFQNTLVLPIDSTPDLGEDNPNAVEVSLGHLSSISGLVGISYKFGGSKR